MDWKLPTGIALVGLAGLTAVGIGNGNLGGDGDDTAGLAARTGAVTPAAVTQAEALDAMAELLDREVEERLRLEEEVASLRSRLARVEETMPSASSRPDAETSAAVRPASAAGGGSRGELTQAAFIEAGFEPERASYLQQAYDEITMAQLYLRDQASREGWLRSARFGEEQGLLQQRLDSLRSEMNEEEYASYLYALGRPNQVSVRRVLAGSAAEAAGLEAGDILTRYDGQRIYAPAEVRSSSRSGEPAEVVSVEVLRDGRRIQTYMPRGPLGVSMSSMRALPDPAGS